MWCWECFHQLNADGSSLLKELNPLASILFLKLVTWFLQYNTMNDAYNEFYIYCQAKHKIS